MTETAPVKFRDRITDKESLLLEAALCAWEWMIENREDNLLKELWDGVGWSAMRHVSMQAGAIALQVHDYMKSKGYEFTDAYDWEFVPGVLRRLNWTELLEDNQYSGPVYQPQLSAIFTAMVAADKCAFVEPTLRGFQKADVLLPDPAGECLDVA